METTWNYQKVAISILLLAVIVLTSALLVSNQNNSALKKIPYSIGSPVIPATDMPAGMTMKMFDVPPSEPAPTISFTIAKDTMGGYDVHVSATNFTFAPEHLNGSPVEGEGHVHLYIDNNLIIMLGPWYHIDSITPGMHTIKAGLFNNDHSAYSVGGKQVIEEEMLDTSASSSTSSMSMN